MKKLSVVGVGLIAGSLSWALKKNCVFDEITGVDRSEKALQNAIEKNIIDNFTTDLTEGIKDADMVILGVPVLQIEGLIIKMSDFLKANAVVLDVGSTKRNVCEKAKEMLPEHVNFIGGHPMTGSELSGVEFADSELFVDRPFILTPREDNDIALDKLEFIRSMLSKIGARPIIMEPGEHDFVMASISHLPHFLAFTLVDCVMLNEDKIIDKDLYAGGFRDTTRIAMGDPDMWSEIFLKNKDYLKKWIRRFIKQGDELLDIIEKNDQEELVKRLEKIKKARKELTEEDQDIKNEGSH